MGEELAALVDMTERLLDERSLESRLQRITDAAIRLTGADHASIRLCEGDSQLRVGARSGLGVDRPAPMFAKGQGLLGWVAETGKVARVADSSRDPRFRDNKDRGFPATSVMSVPIRLEGSVVGVISLSAGRRDAFTSANEQSANLLSNIAGQVLRMAELEQLAITDAYTQAFNRRYMLPRLLEEMRRSARTGRPLSVLLMDLDHFKHVNDEYGHSVGDLVLRAFAETVRRCVRSIDVFVRRGGEEFLLIMPSTDASKAQEVAERIRRRLIREPIHVRSDVQLVQTVSIGVAMWDGVEGPEALDERADLAMYEAKHLGRNRIVIARQERTSDVAPKPHVTPHPPPKAVERKLG